MNLMAYLYLEKITENKKETRKKFFGAEKFAADLRQQFA